MEKSLFIKTFKIRSPILKVLDFLIDNKEFEYSKTDIMKGSGIKSKSTLANIWPELESMRFIVNTHKIGRTKMYKLNKKNTIIKKLIELDYTVAGYFVAKLMIEQKV